MSLDKILQEYKESFGEAYYINKGGFFEQNNIDALLYMDRLANRVKYIYNLYPEIFTGKHVLDYGANFGDQSFILSGIASKVTSFDINPPTVKILRERMPDTITVLGDLDSVTSQSYDTVYCSSVINLQKYPYGFFSKLLGLDFKTLVLIYHDGFVHPLNDNLKQYAPKRPSTTSSLVEKSRLIDLCIDAGLTVLESDLTWKEDIAIDDCVYTQSVLIVEK